MQQIFDTPTSKEVTFTYTNVNNLAIPSGYTVKDMLKAKNLTKADAEPRIYDVTIKVYDKKDTGYAKVLTTMEGTTIQ